MAVNKVVYNTESEAETLIDLTSDTVTPETLAEGVTAHDASGEEIEGTMPTTNVLYTAQKLTDAQQAQARENINAVGKSSISLGVHTDGLIYIFVDGVPVGNGIEQSVGGDVIGYVDENNNIVLTGELAEDVYTVKYETEDGTTFDIGELSLVADGPTYTNMIPLSLESDGTPYNEGQGWKTGYRLSSSSGNETAQEDTEVTGFIPYKWHDTLYISGIVDDGSHAVVLYDSNHSRIYSWSLSSLGTFDGSVLVANLDELIKSVMTSTTAETIAYVRICANVIDNNSIITVNESIS